MARRRVLAASLVFVGVHASGAFAGTGDVAPLGAPDEAVDVGDALVAARMLAGDVPADLEADVFPFTSPFGPDGNGTFDLDDAAALARAAVGRLTLPGAPEELSGIVDFGGDLVVGASKTIRAVGDVTIRVASLDLQGTIVGAGPGGEAIAIEATGDVTVGPNASIVAGSGGSNQAGGALVIQSASGNISIGGLVASGEGGAGRLVVQSVVGATRDRAGNKIVTAMDLVSGGRGADGADLVLSAPGGTLTIEEGAVLHIGNGGNGADIIVEDPIELVSEEPLAFENGGGDSGRLFIDAAAVVGLDIEEVMLDEDFPPGAETPIFEAGETVRIVGESDAFAGGEGGLPGTLTVLEPEGVGPKRARPLRYGGTPVPGASGGALKAVDKEDAPAISRDGAAGGKGFRAGANGQDVSLRGNPGSAPGQAGGDVTATSGAGAGCHSEGVSFEECIPGNAGKATATGGEGAAGADPDQRGGNGGNATARSGRGGVGALGGVRLLGACGDLQAFGGAGGAGGGSCRRTIGATGGSGGKGGDAVGVAFDCHTPVLSGFEVTAISGGGGNSGDAHDTLGDVGAPGFPNLFVSEDEDSIRKVIVSGALGFPGQLCPDALRIDPPDVTLEFGETQQFRALLKSAGPDFPMEVEVQNERLDWSVSAGGLLGTVDESGLFTANSEEELGTATVRAGTLGPVLQRPLTANASIVVDDEFVRIVPGSAAPLRAGRSLQLKAELVEGLERVTDVTIDQRTTTWSTSNLTVAVVDPGGNVTAVSPGSADIVVQFVPEDRPAFFSDRIEIEVFDVEVNPGQVTLGVGEKEQLQVIFEGASGGPVEVTDQTGFVEYESANDNVATVNEGGEIEGVAPGVTELVVRLLSDDPGFGPGRKGREKGEFVLAEVVVPVEVSLESDCAETPLAAPWADATIVQPQGLATLTVTVDLDRITCALASGFGPPRGIDQFEVQIRASGDFVEEGVAPPQQGSAIPAPVGSPKFFNVPPTTQAVTAQDLLSGREFRVTFDVGAGSIVPFGGNGPTVLAVEELL